MKNKILTLLTIFLLLTSFVLAQDGKTEDPIADLGGTLVYESTLEATYNLNTGETRIIGTFTESTGKGSATEYVTVYGETSPGLWEQVQENAFTASASQTIDLAVTVNELESTLTGGTITIANGESKIFYVISLGKIARLIVTNQPETPGTDTGIIAEPTPSTTTTDTPTTSGGGSGGGSGGSSSPGTTATPQESAEEILETFGKLKLVFNQETQGKLELVFAQGASPAQVEGFLWNMLVLDEINFNTPISNWFSVVLDFLRKAGEDAGKADAEKFQDELDDILEGPIENLPTHPKLCKCDYSYEFDWECSFADGFGLVRVSENSGTPVTGSGTTSSPTGDPCATVAECLGSCRGAANEDFYAKLAGIEAETCSQPGFEFEYGPVAGSSKIFTIAAQCGDESSSSSESGTATSGGSQGPQDPSGPTAEPTPPFQLPQWAINFYEWFGITPPSPPETTPDSTTPGGTPDETPEKPKSTGQCDCEMRVSEFFKGCDDWSQKQKDHILFGWSIVSNSVTSNDMYQSQSNSAGGTLTTYAIGNSEEGTVGDWVTCIWEYTWPLGPCEPDSDQCKNDCDSKETPQFAIDAVNKCIQDLAAECQDADGVEYASSGSSTSSGPSQPPNDGECKTTGTDV